MTCQHAARPGCAQAAAGRAPHLARGGRGAGGAPVAGALGWTAVLGVDGADGTPRRPPPVRQGPAPRVMPARGVADGVHGLPAASAHRLVAVEETRCPLVPDSQGTRAPDLHWGHRRLGSACARDEARHGAGGGVIAMRSGRLRRSVRTAPVMCGRAGARQGAPPPSMIHQALGGGGELDAVSSYALPEATQHADESAFRRRSRARHASRRRGRGRARGGIDGGMTLE